MRNYTRTMYRLSDSGEFEPFQESYQQPLVDRMLFLGFNGLVKVTNVKPIHRLIDGPLEQLHSRLHARHCGNDCVTAQVRVGDTDEWVEEPACGLLPLCAQLDLKHYDLDTRNNVKLSS